MGEKNDLKSQETLLQICSKKVNGLCNQNYWERLKSLQLLSSQRRNERYKLLYVWKSLYNLVLSLGLIIKNESRFGPKIHIPKITSKVARVISLKEKLIHISGARIFNSMQHVIREYSGKFEGFKSLVDQYLSEVPDCPIMDGYISHNMDSNSRMSNSLEVWNDNLNSYNWIPDPTATASGRNSCSP